MIKILNKIFNNKDNKNYYSKDFEDLNKETKVEKIFELISSKIQKNSLASPVSLKPFFDNDKSLDELGGASYLVKLASSAISLSGAEDYAKIIFDMAIRRQLILLGGEMIDKATKINLEKDGNQQIADAEKSLYDLALLNY